MTKMTGQKQIERWNGSLNMSWLATHNAITLNENSKKFRHQLALPLQQKLMVKKPGKDDFLGLTKDEVNQLYHAQTSDWKQWNDLQFRNFNDYLESDLIYHPPPPGQTFSQIYLYLDSLADGRVVLVDIQMSNQISAL